MLSTLALYPMYRKILKREIRNQVRADSSLGNENQ